MDATSLSESGQNHYSEADSPNERAPHRDHTNARARNGRVKRRQRRVRSSIPNLHCGDDIIDNDWRHFGQEGMITS
jgi:hypothetical protein